MLKVIEEKENMISELSTKIQELVAEDDNKSKQVQHLMNELGKANDIKAKLEADLSESENNRSHFQAMCSGYQEQVQNLNGMQQDSEREISDLERRIANLCAQVAERDAMLEDNVRLF